MTTQEFSIEFDILYNNLASNSAPPVNAYEKSVFLTKAQSDIVIELYSGRNNLGLSFESSEEVREYLKTLIKQGQWSTINATPEQFLGTNYYGVSISRPTDDQQNDVLFTIKEEIKETHSTSDGTKYKVYPVIPVTQDALHSTLNNPFKGPKSGKRALRLDADSTNIYLYLENKPYTTWSYKETYLTYPSAIIIYEDPDMNGLYIGYEKINGSNQECKLPASLHNMILERAVLLAKMAYVGGQTQQPQQQQR